MLRTGVELVGFTAVPVVAQMRGVPTGGNRGCVYFVLLPSHAELYVYNTSSKLNGLHSDRDFDFELHLNANVCSY